MQAPNLPESEQCSGLCEPDCPGLRESRPVAGDNETIAQYEERAAVPIDAYP
jgi:hypothetical protein